MTIISTGITTISQWTVAPTTAQGAAFTSIQNAINSAAAFGGGTIYISPGTYTENIAFPVTANGITLIGSASGTSFFDVIISGTHTFSPASAANISIQNIRFNAASGDVFAYAGNTTASNLEFVNCRIDASSGNGISMPTTGASSFLTLTNSSVSASLSSIASSGSSFLFGTDSSFSTTGSGQSAITLAGASILTAKSSDFSASFGAGNAIALTSAACSAASSGCMYTAGNSAFRYTANASVGSVSDRFAASGTYFASSSGSFGILNYSLATIISGSSVIDPQIAAAPYTTKGAGSGGGGVVWSDAGASGSVASGSGSFATASITLTLPASPAQGDICAFIADTSGVVTVQAAAGQVIRLGNVASAAAGSAASTARGDSIVLIYRTSGSSWIADSSMGNWSIT